MKNRSKQLNDLIVSLESNGYEVDGVTERDLAASFEEIELAQVSLESYHQAYDILAGFETKNVLSIESYSAVMQLAESGKQLPDNILSMEADGSDKQSMLKTAKDKVVAAFNWLMEKIGNLFKRIRDFMSNAFSKMGKSSKKVAEWFKSATGFKRDVHIQVKDTYLIVKDDKSFYTAAEIEKATDFLYETLPGACAEFIERVTNNIERTNLYKKDLENEAAFIGTMTRESQAALANAVYRGPIESKELLTGSHGIPFQKLKGANVALYCGFIPDKDIVVGSLLSGLNVMGGINPNVSVETISITTRDFDKLKDKAEMLEKKLSEYEKTFQQQKEEVVNKALNKLKDDIIGNITSVTVDENEAENILKLTQKSIFTLITKHLNGAFIMRAQSEQAAIQILACTNKLLWKAYKVESGEMSDSKELAVA